MFSGSHAKLNTGNIIPIGKIPEGTYVCNVESNVGDRGIMARSSGTYALIVSHNIESRQTRIKLPSGQKKMIGSNCRAMVGIIAGGGRVDKPLLKAGTAYHKYKARRHIWPRVRGVAMNPVDHPYGGGNH